MPKPKPIITGACFPKLHGKGKPSIGVVAGPVIDKGYDVSVVDKHSRVWTGTLGDEVAVQIRLATVNLTKVPKQTKQGIDTVTVTVSNGPDTSDPVHTQSDVP